MSGLPEVAARNHFWFIKLASVFYNVVIVRILKLCQNPCQLQQQGITKILAESALTGPIRRNRAENVGLVPVAGNAILWFVDKSQSTKVLFCRKLIHFTQSAATRVAPSGDWWQQSLHFVQQIICIQEMVHCKCVSLGAWEGGSGHLTQLVTFMPTSTSFLLLSEFMVKQHSFCGLYSAGVVDFLLLREEFHQLRDRHFAVFQTLVCTFAKVCCIFRCSESVGRSTRPVVVFALCIP